MTLSWSKPMQVVVSSPVRQVMRTAESVVIPPNGRIDPLGSIGPRHMMTQTALIKVHRHGKKAKVKKARGGATIVTTTRGGKGNSKQKTIGLHSNKSREKTLPLPK